MACPWPKSISSIRPGAFIHSFTLLGVIENQVVSHGWAFLGSNFFCTIAMVSLCRLFDCVIAYRWKAHGNQFQRSAFRSRWESISCFVAGQTFSLLLSWCHIACIFLISALVILLDERFKSSVQEKRQPAICRMPRHTFGLSPIPITTKKQLEMSSWSILFLLEIARARKDFQRSHRKDFVNGQCLGWASMDQIRETFLLVILLDIIVGI